MSSISEDYSRRRGYLDYYFHGHSGFIILQSVKSKLQSCFVFRLCSALTPPCIITSKAACSYVFLLRSVATAATSSPLLSQTISPTTALNNPLMNASRCAVIKSG